jgi:hypothetical protein
MVTTPICWFSANEGQEAKDKKDEEDGTPEVKIESTETLYHKLNCSVIL